MANQPIKQHYIPKSYLKNFAIMDKNSSYLVDAYKLDEEIMLSKVNTKSICVQKNLYTLKSREDEKKYALEIFYANNIDSEYPKVYKLLIDERITKITAEQKSQILYVCLSLYFRTPKYLNLSNKIIDKTFDQAKNYADETGLIKMTYLGENLVFNVSEIEDYKNTFKLRNKSSFQITHLEKWIDFIKFKYECNINVIKISAKNSPLITCDNPISIREFETNRFIGLFNPKNVITLPLDENHFLEIHPNTFADNNTTVNRLTNDADYVFTTNAITQQNAENWLIGKPGSVDKHFALQNKYEKNQEDFVTKIKFRSEEMQNY